MRRVLMILWLLAVCLSNAAVFADNVEKESKTIQPSKEDLEIVKVLEELKLMNMMKDYDLIKDVEILIEEEAHEENN